MSKVIIDNRQALPNNSILNISGDRFLIKSEIGRGSTGIVYSVIPVGVPSTKATETIAIKEIFPLLPGLIRNDKGTIVSSNKDDDADMLLSKIKQSVSEESEKANIFAESDISFQVEVSLPKDSLDNQYILLRKIPGLPLSSFLTENISIRRETSGNPDALPYARIILKIMESLLSSLSTVHEKGYLFLDLKPQNIIVNDLYASTKTIQISLIDFCSPIKVGDEIDIKEGNMIMSTPGYAAPEFDKVKQGVLDIHKLTPAADIYSASRILYELITGYNYIKKVPGYNGEVLDDMLTMNDNEISHCIDDDIHFSMELTGKQDSNGTIMPIIGNVFERNLARVIKRGLMTDPKKRYQSSSEMLDDIRSLISDLDFEETASLSSTFKRNPANLIGRDIELSEITKFFSDTVSSTKEKRSRIFTISGQYGTGKTALAQAFAESNFSRCYDAIVEVYSDSFKDSVVQIYMNGTSFYSISSQISHAILTSSDNKKWEDAFAFIRNCSRRQKLLLIIDNYNCQNDQDAHYFIDLNCDIIITGTDAGNIIRAEIGQYMYFYHINLAERIPDINTLLSIFKFYYRHDVSDDETIIKIIKEHLFSNINAVVSLAKVMYGDNRIFTTPAEELSRLETTGFKYDDARTVSGYNKNICQIHENIFYANHDLYCKDTSLISTIRLMILTTERYGISALHFSDACDIPLDMAHALLSRLTHMGLLYYSKEGIDPFDLIFHKFMKTLPHGLYIMPQVFRDSWCTIDELSPSLKDSYCKNYVESMICFLTTSPSGTEPELIKKIYSDISRYIEEHNSRPVATSQAEFYKLCVIGGIYQNNLTKDAYHLQMTYLLHFIKGDYKSTDDCASYLRLISSYIRYFLNEPVPASEVPILDDYSKKSLSITEKVVQLAENSSDNDIINISAQNDRAIVNKFINNTKCSKSPQYLTVPRNFLSEGNIIGSNKKLYYKAVQEYLVDNSISYILDYSIWKNSYLYSFSEHAKALFLAKQYNKCLSYSIDILRTVEVIEGLFSELSITIREYVRDCLSYLGKSLDASSENEVISIIKDLQNIQ